MTFPKTALAALLLLLAGCTSRRPPLTVVVSNPLDVARRGEAVEIALAELIDRLQPDAAAQFVLTDAAGRPVACQLTSDDKLLFLADIPARGQSVYHIATGTPPPFETRAAVHVDARQGAVVWENDRLVFSAAAYTPGDTTGRAAGYALWVKDTPTPPAAPRGGRPAKGPGGDGLTALLRHGNAYGPDSCPTAFVPPCGATLLQEPSGRTVCPAGWTDYEVLDNGPLRATVRLRCPHSRPSGDTLRSSETRLLSLDAGALLCRAAVRYDHPQADSLVLLTVLPLCHDTLPFMAETRPALLAAALPAREAGRGPIRTGCLVPAASATTGRLSLPPGEAARCHPAALLCTRTPYRRHAVYEYWFGATGSADSTLAAPGRWTARLTQEARKLRHPLRVTLR